MSVIENNFGLEGQSGPDYDEFLGLGSKGKERREKRRESKQEKKALKTEKKELKNEERKAEIERLRAETGILGNPGAQWAPASPEAPGYAPEGRTAAPEEPEEAAKDDTMTWIAIGGGALLLLAIGGYLVWKRKAGAPQTQAA